MYDAIEDVVKVGDPHNFQIEQYHIRSYCYEITGAIRKCMDVMSKVARCDFEPKAESKK